MGSFPSISTYDQRNLVGVSLFPPESSLYTVENADIGLRMHNGPKLNREFAMSAIYGNLDDLEKTKLLYTIYGVFLHGCACPMASLCGCLSPESSATMSLTPPQRVLAAG